MYSYGPPHMAVQKRDDQHEHTFSSYVRIRDVVLKTCLGRWTIGRSGERGSGISVLPARHDDDDDDIYIYCHQQTDCFVVSQLFSVARHARCLKLGSKFCRLYVSRISNPRAIVSLSVSEGIFSYIFIYIYAYRLPGMFNSREEL